MHIPKTAGSAFREILSRHFGTRFLLDYDDRPLAPGFRWRRFGQRVRPDESLLDIERDFDCVHGHFVADKYDRLEKPVRCITWLRDPVRRTVSHYHYWKRVPDLRNPDCRALIERKLSLEEFAALPRMRNVMTRFFGGKQPEDFFFLGTVETMAESLARFHRLTGIAVDAMAGDRADETEYAEPSPSARQAVERLNRSDRELYDKVGAMLAR